jgi:hypothetical protein
MSDFSPENGVHDDIVFRSMSGNGFDRRRWVAPCLAPHSTLMTLTQVSLPQPLSLLFLQASVQCFNHNGNPVPCPPV